MTAAGLSRELLQDALPLYPGLPLAQITLVASVTQLAVAATQLLAADALGFDSESKPVFRKGEASTGPHLIQLATDEQAFLFPVARFPECHGLLKQVLESTAILKIGLGLGNDRSALKTRLDITPHKLLDLGESLRGPTHKGTVGAKVAVAHFFGQRLVKSKKIGTSNWAAAALSERQLCYAANDAHVALMLYRAWIKTGPVSDH